MEGKNGQGEGGGGEGEAPKVVVDPFGQERNAESGVVIPQKVEGAEAPKEGEDGKKKDGEGEGKGKEGEGKGKEGAGESALVEGLRKEIADIKKEYGGNLSGQRDKITTLEDKIKELTGEKKPDTSAFVYDPKDIKRVKDLTKEEQEEMTETEKKQMDELADMKERMNTLAAGQVKDKKDEATRKAGEVESFVQTEAKKLAGDDKDHLNQIIESFNKMKFNTEGMTNEEIAERVVIADKARPDYKAPKEQKNQRGGAAKEGDAKGDDPFGNKAIIEEAKKGKGGAYAL